MDFREILTPFPESLFEVKSANLAGVSVNLDSLLPEFRAALIRFGNPNLHSTLCGSVITITIRGILSDQIVKNSRTHSIIGICISRHYTPYFVYRFGLERIKYFLRYTTQLGRCTILSLPTFPLSLGEKPIEIIP